MQSDRYYKKDNIEKELLEVAEKEQPEVPSSHYHPLPANNSSYIKPEGTLLPKAYLIVFSGGTVREKDYFSLVIKNPSLYPDIKIKFLANDSFEKGGKPQITEFAIDKKLEYQDSANEENPDSYYLLTDVDHFESFLPEMKEECGKNGIELIISNSCFEVWLYYSEKTDRCVGFSIPDDKDKISSAFKTWANKAIKGGLKPTKAILYIEQNINNAKNNYSENNGMPSLFSTQMFRLAEKMLPFVKDGNDINLQKVHRR